MYHYSYPSLTPQTVPTSPSAISEDMTLVVDLAVVDDSSTKVHPSHCVLQVLDPSTKLDVANFVMPSCTQAVVRVGGTMAEELDFTSQTIQLRVLVSGQGYSNTLDVDLGQYTIALPARPVPDIEPLYTKSLLHDSDYALEPMPEIHHQFRVEEKRPLSVISLAFAGACMVTG